MQKKISQAKAKLLVDYPYFGTIASKLELIVDDDIQASKSNGIKLHYNSDFFKELTLSEMEFVFANGAMHASLAHDSRKNNRSGWLWQLATDYAINDMLVENGLDRPWQLHYSQRFKGLYAEEIYTILKEDILRDELEYDSEDLDDIQDSKDNDTQELEQKSKDDFLKEQLFEEFTKSTLESEAKSGELPLDIDRFFKLDFYSKVDWRDELRYAIDKFYKDDYTLIPPNKKLLHLGIYLPSSQSNRFNLVIAVDSSGSIDEKLLSIFLSEVDFLMQTVQNYQIELLVCDDKIQSHQTFYNGDFLECSVKGGGATDFNPVFDYIDANFIDTKLLLYFTDLDGKYPLNEPNYDVRWVVDKESEVPFGTLIVLK